jgi:Rne/Rng family ribonuclease
MSKELFVSSTPHETKVAIVEDDQLSEIYYERENEYTLAGSIYKGRVTRVLPGMQSAFVNVGLERDAFLYVSDFLLEEEEDADGLEQVVSRARVIEAPGPATPDERGPEHPKPLEVEERIPPAEIVTGTGMPEEQVAHSTEGAAGKDTGAEEQDREGARKWRGRRRRRGRGGRLQEREERRVDRTDDRASEGPAEVAPPPRSEPPSDRASVEHPHVLLPGESISKYQPHSPAGPAIETQTKPASANTARPSTEYSFHPSQFSPDSMVLPGESISKYRGKSRRPARATAEEPAEPAAQEHGFLQEAESAGPVPRLHEHEDLEAEPRPEHARGHREEARHGAEDIAPLVIPSPVAPEPSAENDQQRLERMNVASVFGGGAIEAGEHENEQESAPQDVGGTGAASGAEDVPAGEGQPWRASGGGLMEEEEIEEEEIELPAFEEDADLAEYEELEEEVMGPGNDQMVAAGSELTEAVRDAHINEQATGQYEAEALDREELDEVAEAFELAEEGEEEDHELEVANGAEEEDADDLEGARAEHRATAGTAGYQQMQRSERPPGERRGGRRPGRRPMRGRRFQAPRRLPAISDLLKEGQEILVQIAKEPIAKKGARITSHIALPGRFLVYMPTVHHTGVSRKIASEEDRHRLKRIVLSERGEAHGGFIVRTAAAGANEDDLRADIRFLINLWNEIRGRAEASKAPALIYHDLNLVERILRDQVSTSFSAIWVDTEQEYERVLRFVSRFQPSLVKRVKLYSKETPLFEQFNITDEINKALKSKVWLKSGGYIVINQTEALVAIDVNTGKYVGKTARLEDTIVKTNIDAIREIVRQIRLRDLGGIIVIDFIDMDERKNRQKVMQALEDALKADRAPSKVLQFNDFGLVAITRKRVKQSLERTLGQPCPTCQATGMIKSVTTVCNEIYVEMRKMSRHFERDIMLRVNPEVAKALKTNGGTWVQEMEELTGRTVLVKSDALLHPEHFDIQ